MLSALLFAALAAAPPAADGGPFAPGAVPSGRVFYPPGSGVIDVAKQYGAVPGDGRDDTAALPAAIDACPPGGTVFLSGGAWVVEGEALVRGGVRRVVGTNARVLGGGRFVVTDRGSAVAARPNGPIEFADLECRGPRLHHASAGTLVGRHAGRAALRLRPL